MQPGRKRRRKIGGQPGRPKHERQPFAAEDIDDAWEYHLGRCPECGGRMSRAQAPSRVVQQVEVVECPVGIDEHRGLAYYCPHCQKLHFAPLPAEVGKGGLVGSRLTALVAYLKCACRASFSTIRKFLRDVMKISISRGQAISPSRRRVFPFPHHAGRVADEQLGRAGHSLRGDRSPDYPGNPKAKSVANGAAGSGR